MSVSFWLLIFCLLFCFVFAYLSKWKMFYFLTSCYMKCEEQFKTQFSVWLKPYQLRLKKGFLPPCWKEKRRKRERKKSRQAGRGPWLSLVYCYIYSGDSLLESDCQPGPPAGFLPHAAQAQLLHHRRLGSQSCYTPSVAVVQLLSCAQRFVTPWTTDFPVLHHLLEFAQTHVHPVSDAIQPSHPLSSPSPPAFSLPQHQGLF